MRIIENLRQKQIANNAKVVQNASPGSKFLGELFSYFIIGEFFTAACIYLIQGFPSFLNNAAENQTTILALSSFLSHADSRISPCPGFKLFLNIQQNNRLSDSEFPSSQKKIRQEIRAFLFFLTIPQKIRFWVSTFHNNAEKNTVDYQILSLPSSRNIAFFHS
jgi:hypothetical protein